MYLLHKGKEPARICRECKRAHVGACRLTDRELEKRDAYAYWVARGPITVRTLRKEGRLA